MPQNRAEIIRKAREKLKPILSLSIENRDDFRGSKYAYSSIELAKKMNTTSGDIRKRAERGEISSIYMYIGKDRKIFFLDPSLHKIIDV